MLNNTNTDTAADLNRLNALLAAAMPTIRKGIAWVFKSDTHPDVDDCVQATALKVWANPERFLAASNFEGLCFLTAKNTARDWCRKAANGGGRFSHTPADLTDVNDSTEAKDREANDRRTVLAGPNGVDAAARLADLDAFHKAVDAALRPDERRFVLALAEGMEQKDAAKAAGWSAAKASKARGAIMERLAAWVRANG